MPVPSANNGLAAMLAAQGGMETIMSQVSAAHCTWLIAASCLQIIAGSTHSQVNGQFVQVASLINHPQYITSLL